MSLGILYAALAATGAGFVGIWSRHRGGDGSAAERRYPLPAEIAVGFVTDFCDTLGIGSFAPTTSLFKILGLVADHLIPGTLLIGHSLPTLAQAFIYITIIAVDPISLIALIAAAVAGSWWGAGIVVHWSRRRVRLGMGIALLVAAAIFSASALGVLPSGGDQLGLRGAKLVLGLAGNAAFGALMTIGIGAYAPSLILFGLLGLNLKAIFPVMMGSCAFLMPISGTRFLRRGRYSLPAALGLTIGGIPGVLLAAFLVREMPIDVLRLLVIAVVLYTAVSMLRSATRE